MIIKKLQGLILSLGAPRKADTAAGSEASIPEQWKPHVCAPEWNILTSFGLEPKSVRDVPMSGLRIQHRTEWNFDHFLPDHEEYGSRSIVGSPLHTLIDTYEDKGRDWIKQNYKDTDYFKMFRYLSDHEFKTNWRNGETVFFTRTDEDIVHKIMKFIEVHNNIKNNGYLSGKYSNFKICVLETPYENIRLGMDHDTPPFELWSGHHRAASLAALGVDTLRVVILKPSSRMAEIRAMSAEAHLA